MKQFLITLTATSFVIGVLLFVSHAKFAVKYEQVFAEKHIILAESMTLSEKLFLQKKKGFVKFVD